MLFSVKAYVDDHAVTITTETAKEAFAKAVEWHIVEKLRDVSISDGSKSYSIAEFSSLIEGFHQRVPCQIVEPKAEAK